MSNFFKNPRSLCVAIGLALGTTHAGANTQPTQPNILVIMADDMGWSDIAPYGGEIDTPYLSELAKEGVSFTNFFVSPFSSPSRAMFLTGADPHEVGLGNIHELNKPAQNQAPNYVGHLTDNAITLPQRLQKAGYYTVLSGKWHLGRELVHQPTAWGFDDAFALLNGEANNYRYQDKLDSPDGRDLYSHNGQDVQLPEGAFSTDFYTDYLLEQLSKQKDNRPFFAFLAYTAPHSPLQAPQAYIDKYEGRYTEGPQVLANARFHKIKELGLIGQHAKQHPLVGVPTWDSLSDDERAVESKRMQLYAAMVDNMDDNIGRVFNYLKSTGQYDNTIIVFLSDNGAAGASREGSGRWGGWISQSRDNSFHNLGRTSSYVSTGPSWAQASMSPFAYYKGFTTDGGIRSPLIIKAPNAATGGIEGRFNTLKDLTPTLLDLAGVSKATPVGKTPLQGKSLMDELTNPQPEQQLFMGTEVLEMNGNRQVRQGSFKATYYSQTPYGLTPKQVGSDLSVWKLYDIQADPGETTDIAKDYPEVLSRLIQEYEAYSQRVGVVELSDIHPNPAAISTVSQQGN